MTTEDIDFLREYAKCGIYHNYMHNDDELNARIARLNSIIDVEESIEVARQQVRENLSYYIGLADTLKTKLDEVENLYATSQDQVEQLYGKLKIADSLKEDAETRATIWKEKYENLRIQIEHVSDFFTKYDKRII
jgi:uncharacterized protein YjdB